MNDAGLIPKKRISNLRGRIAPVDRVLPPMRDAFAEKRGSGSKWQKIRRRQLEREPLCRQCKLERRTTAAEEVDHVIPLHRGGTHAEDNLQSLCVAHHLIKTQAEERERYALL